MSALTRRQLEALKELHLSGHLSPAGHGQSLTDASTYTLATVRALVAAHVATWRTALPRAGSYSIAPTIHPWADGFGTWHVSVPNGIGNGAAVARAVIRGEVMAREPYNHPDTGYRPRVELDTVSTPVDGFAIYREV